MRKMNAVDGNKCHVAAFYLNDAMVDAVEDKGGPLLFFWPKIMFLSSPFLYFLVGKEACCKCGEVR